MINSQNFSGKTVFITGAEGFLGRHTSLVFKKAGWRVIGLGFPLLPVGEHITWGIERLFRGEISVQLLDDAFDVYGAPDVVVHAAGTSSVAQAVANPYGELLLTVGSTASVVDFVRKRAPSSLILYVSSAAVYGCGWDEPISIDSETNPISMYGLHKNMSEQLITGTGKIYGLNYRIVRYFSLYGPGLTKQLFWDVLRRIYSGEKTLKFGGDGGESRDFLYIEDAARLLLILSTDENTPTIINGASGTATQIKDIVEKLILEADPSIDFEFSGIHREGDPRNLIGDVSNLETINFEPEWMLDDGVKEYVKWAQLEINCPKR